MLSLLVALACTSPPPTPAEPTAPPTAPPVETPTPPKAAGTPWTPPDLPRCADIRLLTEHGFQELADGGYCKLCASEDEMACEMDWPTNDVPSCAFWDELRNGIYAYYGRPFESDRWKAYFAERAWYRADPTFSEERLSAVARANVLVLKQRAEGRVGCMD